MKTLIVVGGKSFTNGQKFVVGRNDNVDYRLLCPKVSRRHLEVCIDGGQILVRDLDSLNGVYLNGRRVLFEKLDNPGQDDLRLCNAESHLRLHFVVDEPTDEERRQGVVRKFIFLYIVP